MWLNHSDLNCTVTIWIPDKSCIPEVPNHRDLERSWWDQFVAKLLNFYWKYLTYRTKNTCETWYQDLRCKRLGTTTVYNGPKLSGFPMVQFLNGGQKTIKISVLWSKMSGIWMKSWMSWFWVFGIRMVIVFNFSIFWNANLNCGAILWWWCPLGGPGPQQGKLPLQRLV